jgi:hypothetical protein
MKKDLNYKKIYTAEGIGILMPSGGVLKVVYPPIPEIAKLPENWEEKHTKALVNIRQLTEIVKKQPGRQTPMFLEEVTQLVDKRIVTELKKMKAVEFQMVNLNKEDGGKRRKIFIWITPEGVAFEKLING